MADVIADQAVEIRRLRSVLVKIRDGAFYDDGSVIRVDADGHEYDLVNMIDQELRRES